jgi:hypothetical protein
MARPKAKTDVTFPGTDESLPLDALRASIAAELAAGLSDVDGIKKTYGITGPQWDLMRKSPMFRAMLKEAMEKLAGAPNAGKRITMKSEIVLEDSIQVLHEIAHDKDAQSAARIDAIKTMGQMAGRNTKEGVAPGTGGGFNLILNLGNGQPGITIEGTPVKPALKQDD